MFKKAKWIWANTNHNVDDYAEFVGSFSSKENRVNIKIACDSVYAFYLNDKLVKFMACSDYPNDKYIDSFDLDILKGINSFKIQVWHYGVDNSHYIKDEHGLIFEISDSNDVLVFSNEETLSREMNEFKNGYNKLITDQLGLGFYYDNSIRKNEYNRSIIFNKKCKYSLREINNIDLLPREEIEVIKKENSILVDLKKETTGFIDLDIDSDAEQEILIAYGEHIIDGGPRRLIGNRDFSIEVKLKKGNNKFLNPLLRIAGRYLEIFYKEPIKVNYVGIRPVKYHHEVINKSFNDPLLDKIYKTCVDTLELCMHEHYEDCPWREQSLYVLDSRNQMLCGYYAFKGFEYQRHNLLLVGKSLNKETGLLRLTSPMGGGDYPIPFFSLNFIKQVEEYVRYSGDRSVLKELKGVLDTIVNTFASRIDNTNLIPCFEAPFWNFYEWTPSNANDSDIWSKERPFRYDLIINASFVYFVDIYNKLFNKSVDVNRVKNAIKDKLLDKNDTLGTKLTQLGSALLCLIGLGNEEHFSYLTKSNDEIEEASLSTRCFVYDALLFNGDKYHDYIIDDIKNRYKKMLDDGATSFYETELGDAAFGGAGSLCHGWSALPIYYLNILLPEK